MALEPEIATAETGPNPELAYMRGGSDRMVLAVPVVVLKWGGLFGCTVSSAIAENWLQLAFATPVVLWAGWPFFERVEVGHHAQF